MSFTVSRKGRGALAIVASLLTTVLFCGFVAAQSKPAPAVTVDTIVYVTKTGSKYHTATCRHAQASGRPVKLGDTALAPCAVCKPPVLPTAKPAEAKSVVSTPTAKPAPASTASQPASTQCAATTKAGARCKRTAAAGSAYCWQHK